MPKQKPGRSRQDYWTPRPFLLAVKKLLNIDEFSLDLAAHSRNAVCDYYFDRKVDGLKQHWPEEGVNWCNPPFGEVSKWIWRARFMMQRHGSHTVMLVPAGVGANWWMNDVHGSAAVYFLNGRLSFDGKAPYPKDCVLLDYNISTPAVYKVWDWRTGVVR